MKLLGKRQRVVLTLLRRGETWPGGWCYGTHSETVTILDSLVRAGLAVKIEGKHGTRETRTHYRATLGPLRKCDEVWA